MKCFVTSLAPLQCVSQGRGAACELRCGAIHPEIPQRGIEGLRPSLPQRQRHRLFAIDVAFRCVSAVILFHFLDADSPDLLACAHSLRSPAWVTPAASK